LTITVACGIYFAKADKTVAKTDKRPSNPAPEPPPESGNEKVPPAAKPPAADAPPVKKGRAYVCTCGFSHTDPSKFGGHVGHGKLTDPGKHESKGLIDLDTGEVIRPPVVQRDLQQRQEVIRESREKAKARNKSVGSSGPQYTANPAVAQQIQLIPRVITMDFSPIIRAAYECAVNLWGWDHQMSLGDFIDTWLYNTYVEHGVTLTPYIVNESSEQREARLEAIRKEKTVPSLPVDVGVFTGDGEEPEGEEEEE
jgi:hypothetical protein